MIGASLEFVIAAVFSPVDSHLRVPQEFLDILNALGFLRVFILVLMTGLLIVREYKLRPTKPKSVPEEQQSLLENGNGSSESYGSVPTAGPGAPRRTQVSGTGWLDYFAGFRVFFPYLWYETTKRRHQEDAMY